MSAFDDAASSASVYGPARIVGAKGACENNMLVRRRLAEKAILGALTQQVAQTQQIRHVIERVEAEVAKLSEHLPETIRTKESELSSEERRLANFVDFIGEGRGSQALSSVGRLGPAENRRGSSARTRCASARYSRVRACPPPAALPHDAPTTRKARANPSWLGLSL